MRCGIIGEGGGRSRGRGEVFRCHDSILKSPEKTSEINGFVELKGVCYTIFERALV